MGELLPEGNLPEPREFGADGGSPDVYSVPYLIETGWNLGFLYVTGLSFAIWLGITAKGFEHVMGFCSVTIIIGLLLYYWGKRSEDLTFAEHSEMLYRLSAVFDIVVFISHFIRRHIWKGGFL
jgi:hypothetical protein